MGQSVLENRRGRGLSQVIDDALEAGREAFRRNSWREAFDLFTDADRAGLLSPEDLESLGEAAWWIGRIEDCIAAHERAYNQYLKEGNQPRAAYMALALFRHHMGKLEQSVAMGWFGRAERLLEEVPEETIEHGWLAQWQSMMSSDMGNVEGAIVQADLALELGARFGNLDVQGFALLQKGRALIAKGEVDQGMELLDEATVGAVSGDLSPLAAGMIYCMVISTCTELSDYRRAGEWTEAAKRWCERQSIAGGFPGICRVHRAEIIRLRGAWAEAEQEARRASIELSSLNQMIAAEAFYEIGEVRLRMGDLEAAEAAFRQAHEMMRDPQPGLSMLRLAQGKVEAATTSISRALADAQFVPKRGKLLPAQVAIAIEGGDLATAKTASEELSEIAELYGTPALRACAETARGELLLAEGDPAAAMAHFRRALQHWKEVDAPYEAARVRLSLAAGYRAEGDEDAATMEAQAARSAFERLGAILDVKASAEFLGGNGAAIPPSDLGSRVTKTFMFTDIVQSTNLVEVLGDESWRHLLRWHDETLRSLFAEHGGQEVKQIGDGFFVAFDHPSEAIECAVAIHRRLEKHRREHGFSKPLASARSPVEAR